MKNIGFLHFLEKHLEKLGKMISFSEKKVNILDLPVESHYYVLLLQYHGKSTLPTPTFSEEISQRSNYYIDTSWKTARMISDYGSEHRVLI